MRRHKWEEVTYIHKHSNRVAHTGDYYSILLNESLSYKY